MHKNKQILVIIGISLSLILVILGIVGRNASKKINIQKQEDKKSEITVAVSQNICNKYSAEFVSNIIEKRVVKTEFSQNRSNSKCIYNIGDDNFLTILIEDNQDIDDQKKSLALLDETVASDAGITMNHFLALKKDKSVKEVYLVLGTKSYINISQSSTNLVSKEKLVLLSQKIADDISGSNQNSVPLPSSESMVATFFSLINEKKIPQAIALMNQVTVGDDSQKQQWGVQFNSFNSLVVKKIEAWDDKSWSENLHFYKVILSAEMNSQAKDAPIPNYGWENGENTRWLTLVKKDQIWKISSISTGP